MFNYYIRLCRIGEQSGGPHNLFRAAFSEDAELTNKENSWYSKLQDISKMIGLTISHNISASTFIEKLENFYKNKINLQFQKIKENNSGKLLFYSKIFNDFEMQKYLYFNIPKFLRNKLTKLRISAHSLAIETGRYCKPVIPSERRFCKFCETLIEDEVHFLFQCPQYSNIRKKYSITDSLVPNFNDIKQIVNPQTFKDLKPIFSFITEALDMRDHPTE